MRHYELAWDLRLTEDERRAVWRGYLNNKFSRRCQIGRVVWKKGRVVIGPLAPRFHLTEAEGAGEGPLAATGGGGDVEWSAISKRWRFHD